MSPELSDYGKRYYADELTKEEKKDLHKQRMKNDTEYKHEQAMKKANKTQGTQANHHVTDSKNTTKSIAKGASNGVLGLAVAGMAAFNTEAKRIADMKNQIN